MSRTWLSLLARYSAAVFVLNLVWDAGHMPLYDLWSTGTIWQIVERRAKVGHLRG